MKNKNKILILFFTNIIKTVSFTEVDVKIFSNGDKLLTLDQIQKSAILNMELWEGAKLKYVLDLQSDSSFLSPGFEVLEQNGGEAIFNKITNDPSNCFFVGSVVNFTQSSVWVALCAGIMGYMRVGSEGIQMGDPVSKETSLSKTLLHPQHYPREKWQCETKNASIEKKKFKEKREVIDLGDEFKVIELYLIVNQEVCKTFPKEKRTSYVKSIVAQSNSMLLDVNFLLQLKKVEYWNVRDMVETRQEVIQENMKQYKKSHLRDIDFDALVVFTMFNKGTFGLCNFNSICDLENNHGWVSLRPVSARDWMNFKVRYFHKKQSDNKDELSSWMTAVTLAHEVAHMMTTPHDDQCSKLPNSIMKEFLATDTNHKWSECSRRRLKYFFESERSFCLLRTFQNNQPAFCGNGVVERGEQCDCGSHKKNISWCNWKCCDKRTCKLLPGADCNSGLCCHIETCKLKGKGVVCRSRRGTCDAEDVCSGAESMCEKRFQKDGRVCEKGRGFCFDGRCRIIGLSCRRMGRNFKPPSISCYSDQSWAFLNSSCGTDSLGKHIPCEKEDRVCGRLVCESKEKKCFLPHKTYHQNYKKVSGLFSHDGTFCAEGKFCLDQKCIDPENITVDIPQQNGSEFKHREDLTSIRRTFTVVQRHTSNNTIQPCIHVFCFIFYIFSKYAS